MTLSGRKLEIAARHLAYAVARCSFSTESRAFAPPNSVGEVGPVSRREQLLSAAARLFDEHGYQSVSMSDIGSAVGIAGPSIYKHFPSKGDILVAVMIRGGERMHAGVAAAYPDRSSAETELTVGALFTVVNNLVRTGRIAARRDLGERLADLAHAVLSSQIVQ